MAYIKGAASIHDLRYVEKDVVVHGKRPDMQEEYVAGTKRPVGRHSLEK